MTRDLLDPAPNIWVPREEILRSLREPLAAEDFVEGRREREVIDKIVILKAWLDGRHRKWSFEWNGVPISAEISDARFIEDLRTHRIRLGYNDVVECRIRYYQDYDDDRGIWINDKDSFEIVEVVRFQPNQ